MRTCEAIICPTCVDCTWSSHKKIQILLVLTHTKTEFHYLSLQIFILFLFVRESVILPCSISNKSSSLLNLSEHGFKEKSVSSTKRNVQFLSKYCLWKMYFLLLCVYGLKMSFIFHFIFDEDRKKNDMKTCLALFCKYLLRNFW